jgi:hypothetical protein
MKTTNRQGQDYIYTYIYTHILFASFGIVLSAKGILEMLLMTGKPLSNSSTNGEGKRGEMGKERWKSGMRGKKHKKSGQEGVGG